ncbi:MAG: hypothetical protein ACYC3I_26555 [Gemmataceae bacterium]
MPRTAEMDEDDLEEGDGLCIAEQHEKMAREGDFQGLWQVLLENERLLIDQAECFRLLLQAIEVAARKDPRKFSSDIFAKVISFTSYLLFRTHFQISTLIDWHDAGMRTLGNLPVPCEVVKTLPSLIQLQEHFAAMAESQARAARMWRLASKARGGQTDGETAVTDELAGKREALPFRVASPPLDHAEGQG